MRHSILLRLPLGIFSPWGKSVYLHIRKGILAKFEGPLNEPIGAQWVDIRKPVGRGPGVWEFADAMDKAPVRLNDADVEAILG